MPNKLPLRYLFAGVALLVALVAAWLSLAPDEVRAVPVGWYHHPPFVREQASTGEPAGYYVDILNEVARRENLRLEYVKTDRPAVLEALGGSTSLVMAMPVSITEDRKRQVDFSWPVGKHRLAFAARRAAGPPAPLGVASHPTVGSLGGAAQLHLLESWQKAGLIGGIQQFATAQELVQGLLGAQVDCILDESEFIDDLLHQHADTLGLIDPGELSAPPVYKAFPVAQHQEWLLKRVNDGLRSMMNDGSYSTIYRKHRDNEYASRDASAPALAPAPAEPRLPDIEIDDHYDSRAILDNYFDLISNESEGMRNQSSLDDIDRFFLEGEREFAAKLHRAQVRLNELLLLIDGQPKNAPYFASFYYRQIEDLTQSFGAVSASLEAYRQKFSLETAQTQSNLNMIQALEISEPDLLWRKAWIETNFASIIQSQSRWVQQLDQLVKESSAFQAKLTGLMGDAEHDIFKDYRGYYAYRFDILGNPQGAGIPFQLNELTRSLRGWWVTLPTQLLVVLPDEPWWPTLLGLAVLIALMGAGLWAQGRRRHGWNVREYARCYRTALLGGFFLAGALALPSTSDNLFFSLAMLFLGLAVTDYSWRDRLGQDGRPGRNPLLPTLVSVFLIDLMTDLLAPMRVILAGLVLLALLNLAALIRQVQQQSQRGWDVQAVWGLGGCIWAGTGLAAWLGYLYPAMMTAIVGGLALSALYAGAILSRQLLRLARNLSSVRVSTRSFISTLVIPFAWLLLLFGAIHWAANVFNANWYFLHLYDVNLVPSIPVQISLRRALNILLAGLLLKFFLYWAGEMLTAFAAARQLDLVAINSNYLVVRYLAWILFITLAFASLQIEWDSLKWIVGGLSVGFGFALKDILENFFAGIILLLGKQVRPGDTIEFGGVYGKVQRINIRASFIRTEDNALVALPNSQVVSKEYRNWTLNDSTRRHQVDVGVAYGSDIQYVIETLLEVMNSASFLLKTRPPDVLFVEFGDNAILLRARFWIPVEIRTRSASMLRQRFEEAFRARGIVIAFPQLDVHLNPGVPEASRLVRGQDANLAPG